MLGLKNYGHGHAGDAASYVLVCGHWMALYSTHNIIEPDLIAGVIVTACPTQSLAGAPLIYEG